jgi:thiopurine S-methyltransferase
MESDFWEQRWAEGRIGWHREHVHEALAANLGRLTDGRPSKVLVPLCGKTVDLVHLARAGHEVVGVELVEQAIDELFAEHRIEPRITEGPAAKRFSADRLTVLCADFFDVTPADVGPIDCVYDRAALIALPEGLRGRYVTHLLELLRPGARVLLVTLDYEAGAKTGPPFAVSDEEVEVRFAASCTIERLGSHVVEDVADALREAGARETTWLLQVRP